MSLRPYQQEAVESVLSAYRGGKHAVCLVAPTGAGKTAMGCDIVRRHITAHGRVLWLAHRIELVSQAVARLQREGLSDIGVISATAEASPEARVQVGSTQTLLARDTFPPATLLVLDEAHHYAAAQWKGVAAHYDASLKLGLTATPERSDGKPLGDIFDHLVTSVQVQSLVEQGFLVPCTTHAPEKALSAGGIAADPVASYGDLGGGRRAIFFCANVGHAESTAGELRQKGIPAECIHADTPPETRAHAIEDLRTGRLQAITNVYVLTEGTDIPPAEVCVLARGFGHVSTYLQCVGRVLRPSPDTGKKDALVLDLAGTSRKRGFGTALDPREFSLEGNAITLMLAHDAQPPPRVRKTDTLREAVTPDITPAEMRVVEVSKLTRKWGSQASPEKQAYLAAMIKVAQDRNYKRGWAVFRFRTRFGHLPWEPPP